MDCRLPGFFVREILQERILSGLPYPPQGDLPKPGIKPVSPHLLHWQVEIGRHTLPLVPSRRPLGLDVRQLLNGLNVGGTSLKAEDCGEVYSHIPFKGSSDLG